MYGVGIVLYSTKGMIIGRKLRQRISVVLFEFLESNRKKAGKFYQSNDFYVFTPQKKVKAMILFYTFYLARGTSWWNRGLQNGRRRQVAGRAGTGLPTTKTIYSRPWTIVRRCRPCRMRIINRGESSSLRRYRDLQNYHRRPADRRTGTGLPTKMAMAVNSRPRTIARRCRPRWMRRINLRKSSYLRHLAGTNQFLGVIPQQSS